MQTLSASFATMVAGNDLLVENEVLLTVASAPQYTDATVACESITIDRQMTTDAPATTRLISGYPAASATVVLSGLFDGYRARSNLCPNPSFEVSNASWGIRINGTIARSTTRAWVGAASGLFTSTASSVFNAGPQLDFATVVGTTYTVSGYVYVPAGTPAVKAFLIGGAVGASTTVNNAWVRCSVTFTATATLSSVVFGIVPGAAGQTFYLDGVLAEATDQVLTYFDGSTPSSDGYLAAWTGTVGLSTSTEQVESQSTGGLGALDLYDPYNPASPIYRELLLGAPVVLKAGLWVGGATPELATMFTGSVDSYDVDPMSGTVTFSCIDGRNKLRSLPTFYTTICDPMPAVEVFGTSLISTLTSPGLTNTYVLDSLLRANGIYASPAARPQAQMFASMAGGGFPQVYNYATLPTYCDRHPDDPGSITEVGHNLGGDSTRLAVQVPGRWVAQVPRSHLISAGCFPLSGNAADGIVCAVGNAWYYEAQVYAQPAWAYSYTDGTGSAITPELSATVNVNTGTLDTTSWFNTWTLTGPGLGTGGVRPAADQWTFAGYGSTSATKVTMTQGWHSVGVLSTITGTTQVTHKVYVDGVLALTYVDNAAASITPALNKGVTSCVSKSNLPCESVNITAELAPAPLVPATFTPSAYLDASLNHLNALVDVSGSDCWTVIQALAGSELGLAGFDELGVFRFSNRYTLRGGATARTVTSDTSLKSLAMSAQAAGAVNRVRVPVNSVAVGVFQALWTGFYDDNTQTIMYTPARSQIYGGAVVLSTPFTGLSTYIYNGLFPPPVTVGSTPELVGPLTGQDGSGYRTSKTITGSGAAVTSGVDFLIYQLAPSTLVVQVQNHNSFSVYFVTPTGHGYAAGDVGKPLMLVGGCPVIFGASATSSSGTATPSASGGTGGTVSGLTTPANANTALPDANSQWVVDGAKEVALQLPANSWVQDATSAQQLADDVLEDLIYPRPVLSNISIVADPRLQLADRLHLADPDASGMDDDVIAFGVSTTISATAWDQALDARALNQPGYWVLGQAGHSELNLTTWM